MEQQYLKGIATNLQAPLTSVSAVEKLITEGATIPFIARYRKEVTGNLDEVIIEQIAIQIETTKKLIDRKETILQQIDSLGKLTPQLQKTIEQLLDKDKLEDLYLPYKPKRKNKASTARELGMEPMAQKILNQEAVVVDFKNIKSDLTQDQLKEHLMALIAEMISEQPELMEQIRTHYTKRGRIESKKRRGCSDELAEKWENYLKFGQSVTDLPSYRTLALLRGEDQKALSLSVDIEESGVDRIIRQTSFNKRKPFSAILNDSIAYTMKHALHPKMESFLKKQIKERADLQAIELFRTNLKQLLLQPPLGEMVVMGIDPGYRTGCKLVVVGDQGKLLANDVIFPVPPFKKEEQARSTVHRLIKKHGVKAVAIGNGTAGRETLAFFNDIKRDIPELIAILVNEAGASIYSASEVARNEFPDYDITVRGAVSIARRLQDPLSELVKIDPKSLGIGEYQHDVNQKQLKEGLDFTVSSIVNRVGVDLNRASIQLLANIAGLSPKLAQKIVTHRDTLTKGFKRRKELLKVPGIGAKTYQQAIGFLKVNNNTAPLDGTRVHPESYPIAERIIKASGETIPAFFNLSPKERQRILKEIDLTPFKQEAGSYTLNDMIDELIAPSRDPREQFENISFAEGINTIEDLHEGMILNGVVNNITGFGAFIDIGIKESGLVHISQLANRFIKDVSDVVTLNQFVKVKVIGINMARKQVQLSMKAVEEA